MLVRATAHTAWESASRIRVSTRASGSCGPRKKLAINGDGLSSEKIRSSSTWSDSVMGLSTRTDIRTKKPFSTSGGKARATPDAQAATNSQGVFKEGSAPHCFNFPRVQTRVVLVVTNVTTNQLVTHLIPSVRKNQSMMVCLHLIK